MLWQPGYAVLGARFSLSSSLCYWQLWAAGLLEFNVFRWYGVLRFTFPQERFCHRVHVRHCTLLPRNFWIFATSDQ